MTITTTDLDPEHETVFGLNLSVEQYDRLFFRIKAEWRSYEGALFTSKWFDYRFMGPVAATYLYAHEFTKVYRRFYREAIDHGGAEHVRPMKNPDLFKCPAAFIGAMWRGRQHADAMGIPYGLYIGWAMEGRLRFWRRSHLPQPQQLYSGEVCTYVAEQWEKHQLGVLEFGRSRAYRLEHYVGAPIQNDHHEWLLSQAAKRENQLMALEDMHEARLLPIEKIRARFGDEIVEQLCDRAESV